MSNGSIPQTGQQREIAQERQEQEKRAITDRIPNAQTNVAGGISVEKGETQAAVDVTVVVEYGVSIVEVGNAIRRNIIEQVEGTTGLEVIEVNVNVTDVHLPDEDDEDSRGTDLK